MTDTLGPHTETLDPIVTFFSSFVAKTFQMYIKESSCGCSSSTMFKQDRKEDDLGPIGSSTHPGRCSGGSCLDPERANCIFKYF